MKKAFNVALIAGYAFAVSVRNTQLAQLMQSEETKEFAFDPQGAFPNMSDAHAGMCKKRYEELAANNDMVRDIFERLDSDKLQELQLGLCLMCGASFDEIKRCMDKSVVIEDVQQCMGRDPSWFAEPVTQDASTGCLIVPEGSGATFWVDDTVYDLPVHIKYTFKVTSISGPDEAPETPHHEFISVFGNGDHGSDGLTWYLATHRNDFSFRTDKYGKFPESERHRPQPKLIVGEEHTGEIFISESLAEFYLDKQRQYSARLDAQAIPTSGKFGFTSYSGKGSSEICDFKTIQTYELPVGSHAPVWVDTRTSTLPLHIHYRFRVTSITEDGGNTVEPPVNPHHEFIGIFGDPNDFGNGVTWYVATHRTDFQFRGKLYNVFPQCELKMDPIKLNERKIYGAEVYIDETTASLKLNGEEYYTCTFEAGILPTSGQVAFTSYNGAGSSEVWSLFHLNNQHNTVN